MIPTSPWLLCLSILGARAQSTSVTPTSSLSTLSAVPTSDFEGSQYTYLTITGQSTVTTTSTLNATSEMSNDTASSTSTSGSQNTRSQSSNSLLNIAGTAPSRPNNGTASTASATSSAALPSNTLPCNNHPEFCNRKYSNITEVCAHNSAFDIKNNAASNQALGISDQLNDGIRMLQGETHFVNNTIYNCHTTCSLLNGGTWQTMLETLVTWLESNPYDVVTVLIVNSDFVEVGNYTAPIENSGIRKYLYEPEYIPQHRDQWPTLGHMILSGTRVVMFMDYNANQTTVPYILDEFTHMFETPFSPTDQSFPCTEQRPPHLDPKTAKDQYMYLANHNLNTAVDLGALTGGSSSESLLIPTYSQLNITNGAENQIGQLEAMRQNCTREWDRPPNFLLVDYYNDGTPSPGSVFEVAARANGVTYNRRCCGYGAQSAAPALRSSYAALAVAMVFVTLVAW